MKRIKLNQFLQCEDTEGNILPYQQGLKLIRRQLGYGNVYTFAERLGCSPRTLEAYDSGRIPYPPVMLLGMIKKLMEEEENE